MSTTWYQCNVCHILLQNLHRFIVHKSQHAIGGLDSAEGISEESCHQLFHGEAGLVGLEEVPQPNSSKTFLPKFQLRGRLVEKSLEQFLIRIYSPTLLIEPIEIETEDPPPSPSSLHFEAATSQTLQLTNKVNDWQQNLKKVRTGEKRVIHKVNGRYYARCNHCGRLLRTDWLKHHSRNCRGLVTPWRCSSLSCEAEFPNEAALQSHVRLANHGVPGKVIPRHQSSSGHDEQNVVVVPCTSSRVPQVRTALGYKSKKRRRRLYGSGPTRIRKRRYKECPSCGGSVLDANFARHFRACSGHDEQKVTVPRVSSRVPPIRTALGHKSRKRRRRQYGSGSVRIRKRLHKECPSCGGSVLDSNLARHYRACVQRMKQAEVSVSSSAFVQVTNPTKVPTQSDANISNTIDDTDQVDKLNQPTTDCSRNHRTRTRPRSVETLTLPDTQMIEEARIKRTIGPTLTPTKLIRRRGANGRLYKMAHCEYCRRLIRINAMERHHVTCRSNQEINSNLSVRRSTDPTTSSKEHETHTATGSLDTGTDVVATEPHNMTPLNQPNHGGGRHIFSFGTTDFRRRKTRKIGRTCRPRIYKTCPACGIYTLNTNLARHLKTCSGNTTGIFIPPKPARIEIMNPINPMSPPRRSSRVTRERKDTKLPPPQQLQTPSTPPHQPEESNSKSPPKSYCPICGRVQLAENLSKHLEVCDGTVQYSLKMEQERGVELITVSKPERRVTKRKLEDMPSCPSCGRHMRASNMSRHLKLCQDAKTKRPWRCTEFGCNSIFQSSAALNVHKQIYHVGVRKYKCRQCKKPFATELSLQNHMRRTCQGSMSKIEEGEPVQVPGGEVRKGNVSLGSWDAGSLSDSPFVDENNPQKSTTKPPRRRERSARTVCGNCGRVQLLGNAKRHQKNCERRKHKTPWTCTHFGCAISLRTFEALERHVKIYHTGTLPFKCEYCSKRYATNSSIREHYKICRSKREQEAKSTENVSPGQEVGHILCDGKTNPGPETSLQEQHVDVDPLDQSIRPREDKKIQTFTICEKCGRTLPLANNARHLVFCKGKADVLWRCYHPPCIVTFNVHSALRRHVNTYHSNEKPQYMCETCGNLFATRKSLASHRYRFRARTCVKPTIQPAIEHPVQSTSDDKSLNFVQHAPVSVPDYTEIKTNAIKIQESGRVVPVPRSKTFDCEGCGKPFDSSRRARRHFLRYCKYKFDDEDAAKYDCNLCHKTFATSFSLGDHMRRTCIPNRMIGQDHRPKPKGGRHPATEVSDEIELALENVETVILVGEGLNETDQWEIGGTEMNSSNPLYIAPKVRNEKGEGRWQVECRKCGRVISSKNSRHMRLCQGDDGPRWKCDYHSCPSTFNNESSRDVHVKLYHHTKRDFSCGICERKYPTALALRRHQARIRCRKIEEEDPIASPMECGYCYVQFPNQESLIEHFKTPCTGTIGTSVQTPPELCSTPPALAVQQNTLETELSELRATTGPAFRVVVKLEEDLMVQENIFPSQSTRNSKGSYDTNEVEGLGFNLLGDYEEDSVGDEEFQMIIPDMLESDSESE